MKQCVSCLVYYVSNTKTAIGSYFIRAAKTMHKRKAIREGSGSERGMQWQETLDNRVITEGVVSKRRPRT